MPSKPVPDSTTAADLPGPILEAGRNCWRLLPARRVGFCVDGASFFAAFRAAALRAQHSLLILAWDLDSRVRLLRNGEDDAGLPSVLVDFLDVLVRQRPNLHVHILSWDYAVIYAAEREMFLEQKFAWGTHPRIHFRLDNTQPLGASHHQKVVVVDDTVAFVGGLDLTKFRWDTSEHRPGDPRRVEYGSPYHPFHDVQMLVEGPVAASLGDLARARWHRATGQRLRPPPAGQYQAWPEAVTACATDVLVGIARTAPAIAGRRAIGEVQRLYLDAIAAARDWIYIENQFFTSSVITQALASRLQVLNGPEVVLVLPLRTGAWLEQTTMDVVRGRVLKQLREADRHGRLRVYYPDVPGLGNDAVEVHSKVLIVDADLLRVGSSNCSNRSMGLDTECDLAFESHGDPGVRQTIAGFRNQLLAEHLGTDAQTVEAALRHAGSLIGAVEHLRSSGRSLQDLDGSVPEEIDANVPDAAIIDPGQPVDAEGLVNHLIPASDRPPLRLRLYAFIALLVLLLGLAGAWQWTPLGESIDIRTLYTELGQLGPVAAGFMVVGGFVLGGLLVIPVTALITVTGLLFGPGLGLLYALLGVLMSAAATYAVGQFMGQRAVRELAGERIQRLSQRLARRGILTMMTVRLLPIAPYTIVNVVAGASHIRFRDYIVGTLLGMLPGTVALVLLAHGVHSAITDPSGVTLALLAGLVVLLIIAALVVRRWLGRAEQG